MDEELADEEGVASAEVAERGVSRAGSFLRSLPRARSARTSGSVVPANRASEHGTTGGAEQARGDRGELDPGVVEALVEAVGVAGALLNDG